MSVRRLASTSAAMLAVALLLASLSPPPGDLVAALAAPQGTVDTAGADTLLLSAAAAAAWCAWAWGALGLVLTAASAAPGLAGVAARLLLRAVLPAGARRAAAVALGVGLGLGVASPALAGLPAGPAAGPTGAVHLAGPDQPAPGRVPDRPPATTAHAVPDWPGSGAADPRVVVAGDCLWDIAADALRRSGTAPRDGEVATAVQAWWSANAEVIGPDPDLILPGQVLQPPSTP